MPKQTAWQKFKNYVKTNPEETVFWGMTGTIIAGSLALSAWIIKASADADRAEIEALEADRQWYRDQADKGRVVMYDSFGHAVAFDPMKPLYRAVED